MIVNMIGFDSSRPINCQIFAYTAAATAFGQKLIVSAIVLGIWVAYVGTLIHGKSLAQMINHSYIWFAVRYAHVWSPLTNACDVLNSADSKLAIIIALSTDLVLLLIILIGLLRWRFKKGLIWLLLATVAYVPAVMFQTPALVTVTIAATRMYRSLSDYGSRACKTAFSVSLPKRSALSTAETNEIWVSPIPLGHFDSFVVADGKMHDGPHGLGDVERGVEK
ncbi:hypothetical protein F5148DRAFT_1218000 [Russula earlei]|uniref:Uncharacterized protein n=1 Tax=Russula earlei TaxID=71964 RepID=A0ACC0U376_9AGAM|nr:hypothetical protein F5148DRAFT_1218000 [Russula earlei]